MPSRRRSEVICVSRHGYGCGDVATATSWAPGVCSSVSGSDHSRLPVSIPGRGGPGLHERNPPEFRVARMFAPPPDRLRRFRSPFSCGNPGQVPGVGGPVPGRPRRVGVRAPSARGVRGRTVPSPIPHHGQNPGIRWNRERGLWIDAITVWSTPHRRVVMAHGRCLRGLICRHLPASGVCGPKEDVRGEADHDHHVGRQRHFRG